jgi:hypothetical protein
MAEKKSALAAEKNFGSTAARSFAAIWLALWHNTIGYGPPRQHVTNPPKGPTVKIETSCIRRAQAHRWIEAKSAQAVAAGKTYSNDEMVGASLDSDAFLSNINPGNQVRVQSVFDVPPGTQPSAVEPYDSGYSGGAIVTLAPALAAPRLLDQYSTSLAAGCCCYRGRCGTRNRLARRTRDSGSGHGSGGSCGRAGLAEIVVVWEGPVGDLVRLVGGHPEDAE